MKGSPSLLAIICGATARLLGAVSGEAKAVSEGGRSIDSMPQGTRSYPFNLSLFKSEQPVLHLNPNIQGVTHFSCTSHKEIGKPAAASTNQQLRQSLK